MKYEDILAWWKKEKKDTKEDTKKEYMILGLRQIEGVQISKFKEKIFKVSLNANFSCPNLDGTVGYGGCIYCSKTGSGEFAGNKEDEIDEYFSNLTGANNELEKQAELLKTLNNQFEETLKAFKQAEEYYLIERQHQDAVRAIEFQGGFPTDTRKVNDMILTPHGNFSTAPDDFLLAMKDPTMLMKNNVGEIQTVVNVQVINNAGNIVTTTATESINEKGQKELVVMISRAVANDYASGRNGWDSAISSRNIRARGRNY